MKNAKQLIALILCLAFCFAILLPSASRADFGSFSGDSDYGGGGSSSWDSGSSWSDGDGGDSELTFFELLIISPFLIIFVLIFIKAGKKGNANTPAGGQRTSDAQLTPMERYQALDPGFDHAAFTEKLANLYVQMQDTWQNKNISPVRPYLTDALYSQMERQLDAIRRQGYTNYIERIAVLGVLPRGYYQRGNDDHIVVELRTRIVDYTKDDATGKLISGDPQKERFMTYEWDLVRPSGTLTAAKDAVTSVRCPSCGAPLSINQSAKCPYCESVVTLAKHDWAIYAIKGVSQKTR